MKILHVNETMEVKGGVEVYINGLLNQSEQFGFQSSGLAIYKKEGMYYLKSFGSKDLKILKEKFLAEYIRKFLANNKIDIVNIHNIFDPYVINIFLTLIPVVKSVHSPNNVCPGRDKFLRFSENPCEINWGTGCIKRAYTEGCAPRNPLSLAKSLKYITYELKVASKSYARVFVFSDYIKRECIKAGISKNKVIVNPYFTDIQAYKKHKPSTKEIKRLFFAGRLVTSKGVHKLIHAVEPILKENPEIILDIVGDGIEKNKFQKLANILGLEASIVFHGWTNRKRTVELMRESKIVIFPSIYPEAFGIVGIEAMSLGKPVVAYDVGGVSTWLEDGRTGFLVESKSVIELREKIQLLLDKPLLYNEFSMNSQIVAKEKFSAKRHIQSLNKAYKAIVNEGSNSI